MAQEISGYVQSVRRQQVFYNMGLSEKIGDSEIPWVFPSFSPISSISPLMPLDLSWLEPKFDSGGQSWSRAGQGRQHNIAIEHGPLDDLPWLTMIYLYMVIFHSYVKFPEAILDEDHQHWWTSPALWSGLSWPGAEASGGNDQVARVDAGPSRDVERCREMSRDVESHEASHATHAMNDGYWCQLVYYGLLSVMVYILHISTYSTERSLEYVIICLNMFAELGFLGNKGDGRAARSCWTCWFFESQTADTQLQDTQFC